MEFTVNVDSIDLADVIGYNHDDTERTLGDKIAEDIVVRIANGPHWETITTWVEKVRDEMIRTTLAPILAEAMENPTVRTNFLGMPTGDKRTMRELILEHTRDLLNAPIDGRQQNGTVLEQFIRREIVSTVQAEIIAAVAEVRDRVLAEIGENIPDLVGAAVHVALKAR
ncbi:hypothetical protein [Catenulispora pinisilvae]|uniref:hypothetical protein n=1 Tax=Catenulispora pinisilvae TaxID=2705253 RepID=UPI0018921D91|nr:hypothetical protein [Catenulispora pinisilvae]